MVGTGFLIEETIVITCAHVVAAALGILDNQLELPEALVYLDFPLAVPEDKLIARVLVWQPVQPNGGGDIAILNLESIPAHGAKEIHLLVAEDLWDHSFRVFGFPYKHDQGVWASGKLRAREATGWIQIEDIKDTGKQVLPGFSGGAVWDEQLNGIVGMVVAADEDTSKVAYIIPTKVLIQVWPKISQPIITPCPYRGLFGFSEQDAVFFYGRKLFTDQLVDTVCKQPLTAVVGASGSGKSSLVFAGLVPSLKEKGNWLITSCRPGKRPFLALAKALLSFLEPQMSETDRLIEVNKLARQLEQRNLTLPDVLESILEKISGMHLLLIVDQFEELFTSSQEQMVHHFLDELLAAINETSLQGMHTFTLVLTLRADFVGQALKYRPFADALQHADLKLGPMNAEELRDAIIEPVKGLRIEIEGGLAERIISDLGQSSDRLPLLEFALTLLWTEQQNGKMTHQAYEKIGGVERALSKHAEAFYQSLSEYEQLRAEQVFVQLVHPGERMEDIRRTATREELGELNWELVMHLAGTEARLVVSGRDNNTGEEIVELVHEALIRGWPRLRGWIEKNRAFRMWQDQLRFALSQWQKNHQNETTLLHGILLAESKHWLEENRQRISEKEKDFLFLSIVSENQEISKWISSYGAIEKTLFFLNRYILSQEKMRLKSIEAIKWLPHTDQEVIIYDYLKPYVLDKDVPKDIRNKAAQVLCERGHIYRLAELLISRSLSTSERHMLIQALAYVRNIRMLERW